MKSYLDNVEYAVKKVLTAINHDNADLIELISRRKAALKKPGFLEELGWATDLQEDFDESRMMNYFYQAKEARRELNEDLEKIDNEIQITTDSIKIHKSSVSILCGSLLQFAKQGISIVHPSTLKGLPATCPTGRSIGSETLSNVIWQARNHAIHSEESPTHNKTVTKCFTNLENNFGEQLCLAANPGVNLSKEVVDVLDWSVYARFADDMLSLARQ